MSGVSQLVTPLVINGTVAAVFGVVFLACRRRHPAIYQVRSAAGLLLLGAQERKRRCVKHRNA